MSLSKEWMLSSRRLISYVLGFLLMQVALAAKPAYADCFGIACLMGGPPGMAGPASVPMFPAMMTNSPVQFQNPIAMDPRALGQWQAQMIQERQNQALMGLANFVNYNGAQKFGVNTSPYFDARPMMPPIGGPAIVNKLVYEQAIPACMEDGSC